MSGVKVNSPRGPGGGSGVTRLEEGGLPEYPVPPPRVELRKGVSWTHPPSVDDKGGTVPPGPPEPRAGTRPTGR